MAQPQMMQIKLSRFDAQPWGFRLQGGTDFAAPLLVQKVNGGSIAEKAGLVPGDSVIKINDTDVFNLRHKDAQDIVVRSGNNFVMTIQRGGSTWRPHVQLTGNMPQPNSPHLQTVTKTSLAHKQPESQHIGCGYNNAARPFGSNGVDGNVKSIVNKQYNSPVGIYSDESIAETLSAQAEVLAGGVLGVNFKKNEKEYQADKSEVLKFLREEESGHSTPVNEPPSAANYYFTKSHAIGGNERHTPQQDERIGTSLQQNTLAPAASHRPSLPTPAPSKVEPPAQPEAPQQPDPRLIVMPVCPALQTPEYKEEMEKAAAAAAASDDDHPKPYTASGHPACSMCGVGIVGVFVRIKDKNLHVECFKCATCGTNLKNQGYYNFNNKLYCDIHAKLAAQQNPPAGTEGYVPIPIKPNTKLSATTISSALSAHGYNNGVSNGSSTPTPAPVAPTPCSNIPIVDKSLINSNSNININNSNSNSNPNNINNSDNNSSSNITVTNETSANMATVPSVSEQQQTTGATNGIGGVASSAGGGDKPFEYVTLTGNVIRSVVPPGKGANPSYRVNQGYVRPFGAAPQSAAPKSPVSFPPQQQQWNAPPPTQPKPAGVNPYATLPRSNAGPQETEEEGLQPQYAETYFEEDYEVEEVNRQMRSNFCWPPQQDDCHHTPTAAPLYIPPPETQHVVTKPIENPPPPETGEIQSKGQDVAPEQQQQQQQSQQSQSQWQSRSAPQLTSGVQSHECESGSDSYTSTCTTTTTTSEEYQRMYNAQAQAYQMQQMYEQSGSEFDYHMDLEVAAMQQNSADHLQLSSSEYLSGRRSAQECVDALVPSLTTYKLVDMVREVTPSPVPQQSSQGGPRHVVFNDEPEVKVVPVQQGNQDEESQIHEMSQSLNSSAYDEDTTQIVEEYEDEEEEERLVIDDRSHILESQRIFQPTPEIKFEIAPVRQIPPTKIPNPTPKEWINPMVAAFTTAPETPFHMVGCLCPKPCDECCCQMEPEEENPKELAGQVTAEETYERPLSPEPEPEPVRINSIWDSPSLSSAMTIAPPFELKFAPPASEGVPLPEETVPYMPPPIEIKPYLREDYRPKSPFVSALTVAPERPFEGHFDHDVPIHELDLPTPKGQLTMSDALCTAPEREYTPLNPENATHRFDEQQKEQEKKKYEFQVLGKEDELGIRKQSIDKAELYTTDKRKSSTSAFAAMQAFQPSSQPLSSTSTSASARASISYTQAESDLEYQKFCDAQDRYQKRRSYFSQKEQELLEQQQQQQQQQKQKQTNTTSQKYQQQTNTREESSLYSSTKASSSSSNSSSAVQQQQQQQQTSSYASNLTQASTSSYLMAYDNADVTLSKQEAQEIIEETAEELEHSEVLFPPPSPLSHLKQKTSTGLHRPDNIPKYQRNWTVLPTQSPVRTPEPQELRENVPLAFVDTPKTPTISNGSDGNTVHKPVARSNPNAHNGSNAMSSQSDQRQRQTASTSIASTTTSARQSTKPIVPIIIEDRSGPVTMAFQALDEHVLRDQSQTPSRPYTPSRPAPIVPSYQTPEKLCFDECEATHARAYDRGSASPFPDRARSPAPGPPPNPLAAIRAPRLKDNDVSTLSPRGVQAGSITTGQSYLGVQQAQQQGRMLSHAESSSQSGMQRFTQEPERREEYKMGNMTMQRKEQSSHMEEQQQSQSQSQTTTQIGNTQIERRRKVTEEFEHTSSAKTVEIRTGSQSATTERRLSYGKGYVANQARRLSTLEQEISNLTPQSQAISARAANLTETKFPEIHGGLSGESKFPTKPLLPPHDEPQPPSYFVSGASCRSMAANVQQQQQEQKQSSAMCGTSLVSSQQQQQQQKSLSTYSSMSSSQQQQQQQVNTVSSSLTKASATTLTNNQAYKSITAGTNQSATSQGAAPTGVCPVTGTFCRPGHTCCKQQNLQINNNNRPNASLGSGNASNLAASSQQQQPQPQQQQRQMQAAPAPAPASNASANVTTPSNVGGSAGSAGGVAPKGGAFGATSAPKRGRGIMNKAVGPGARVPLCNSCSTQIRGPFITALGKIWCPEHFHCVNGNCRRPLQDIGFVEEKGDLYCEYCFEKYLAPSCSKCAGKIKGDCLNAIGKHFHPECFSCGHCGKLFGNTPFFLEDGMPYCEADWNELFTTKCFACGFPVEAGDRWVEALNHNYHSQCFNCTYCKQNLEGQSFYNKGGRPFCKNHAR